jgi:methionyl aminopeptidase
MEELSMAGISHALTTIDRLIAPIKTAAEIAGLRAANRAAGSVLAEITPLIQPGVTLRELDTAARARIAAHDMRVDRHALHVESDEHYELMDFSDQMALCYGVNDSAFMHAVTDDPLYAGDVLSIDCSVMKSGWSGDTARMWLVGQDGSLDARRLIHVANITMWVGLSMCRPGVAWQDIASAMEDFAVGAGLQPMRYPAQAMFDAGVACSHSIGRSHNDGWNLVNFRHPLNEGKVLEPGMTITIEPVVTLGDGRGALDEFCTGRAVDGSLSGFWEHVVAITADGCDVLDLRPGESVPSGDALARARQRAD